MKRILFLCPVAGLLLLAAPLTASAAPWQNSDASGPTLTVTLVIISFGVVALVARNVLVRPAKPAPLGSSEHRDYGSVGGAVCRSCGLPFARNFLDLNLLGGKLTRCPHCGKLAILSAATPDQLYAAEDLERRTLGGTIPAAAPAPVSEEEKLRRRIEDSRYE
jgi:hypothetical protein